MNEKEKLNTETEASGNIDYSFDFSDQVSDNKEETINEVKTETLPIQDTVDQANNQPEEVLDTKPKEAVESNPVDNTPTIEASEPKKDPKLVDVSVPILDENATEPEVATNAPEETLVNTETPAKEETPVQNQTTENDTKTETPVENTANNKKEQPATKSGKSTIVFGIALLILIALFIIALPFIGK